VIQQLDKLLNISSLYSVELSEKQIKDSSIQKFLINIRKGFFGDAIPKSVFCRSQESSSITSSTSSITNKFVALSNFPTRIYF